MTETTAFEELAEAVTFGTLTAATMPGLSFSLKPSKTMQDVINARHLRQGQPPGDFERMIGHVERNLRKVVDFNG